MRIIVISLLTLMNVILESTLFQNTRIYGIKPDFVVVFLVAYAILRGSSYAAFLGLGSGLLIDMLYGRTFGINGFSYMLTGYLIGQVHENVFKDSYIPAFIFNIAAVFVFQHLYYMLEYFTNNLSPTDISYVYVLMRIILPQCLYNAIVGTILYRYIYKLDRARFMDRRIY